MKAIQKGHENVKVILIDFFDIHGLVHHEFVPESQTVNRDYYVGVL